MPPRSNARARLPVALWSCLALAAVGGAVVLGGDLKEPAPMPPTPSAPSTAAPASPTSTDRPALPAIDRAAPKKTETATFALG